MANLIQEQNKFSVLAAIVFCCLGLSNATVYYVKPDDNTNCSHIKYECHILSYYLEKSNVGSYFKSDTTMVFLQGTHSANRSATIKQVSSLTLVGEAGQPSAKIMCNRKSVGFEFFNMTDLHIQNLTFSECGQAVSVPKGYTCAAIRFNNVTNLSLLGLTVSKSMGYGLYADKILGNFFIKDSTFMWNNGSKLYYGGNAIFFYSHCPSTREINSLQIEASRFLHGCNPYNLICCPSAYCTF